MNNDCPNCNSTDTVQTPNGPRRCNDCALLFTKNGSGASLLGPDPRAVRTHE